MVISKQVLATLLPLEPCWFVGSQDDATAFNLLLPLTQPQKIELKGEKLPLPLLATLLETVASHFEGKLDLSLSNLPHGDCQKLVSRLNQAR